MTRTIAYARVSTDKQDAENQRSEIERYLASRGLVAHCWVETADIEAVIRASRPSDTIVIAGLRYFSDADVWGGYTTLSPIITEYKRNLTICDARATFTDSPLGTAVGLGVLCMANMVSSVTDTANATDEFLKMFIVSLVSGGMMMRNALGSST